MSKTLAIILSQTRASDLTFESIKKNVIDTLNADLCVCIGVKSNYNYNDPFYKLAKYRFIYNESEDENFAKSIPYSYSNIMLSDNKYEKLENVNFLNGKIPYPRYSDKIYKFLGEFNTVDDIDLKKFNDYDSLVYHKPELQNEYSKQLYGIIYDNNNWVYNDNVITFKKNKHYSKFADLKNKMAYDEPGVNKFNNFQVSTYLHVFFLWFLQKNLIDYDLLSKYDRFIIMRSDYIFSLPFPSLKLLNKENIWIPNGEDYHGLCDRFVLLSRDKLIPYINIMENFYKQSNKYYKNIQSHQGWNMEKILKMHLKEQNILNSVKRIPYIMYAVRAKNGTTRWAQGKYNNKLGYYIKYSEEYDKAMYYKKEFEKSGLDIDQFYEKYIMEINNKVEKFTLPNKTFSRNKILILSTIILSIIIFIYIIKRLK